jgi:hypothetical protein
LGEVILKGEDHIAKEDQPVTGAGIIDVRRLLGGDVQLLTE